MFDKEARFGQDYFFKEQALASGTDAQVSGVLELGNTEGGIRVHGWLDKTAAGASGNTIKVELETADTATSTAWTKIADQTFTATGTAFSGDLFSFVPDVGANEYMRVKVTNATGMTGTFSVRPELIP